MAVPLNHHPAIRLGFSTINHPAIGGTPMTMDTPTCFGYFQRNPHGLLILPIIMENYHFQWVSTTSGGKPCRISREMWGPWDPCWVQAGNEDDFMVLQKRLGHYVEFAVKNWDLSIVDTVLYRIWFALSWYIPDSKVIQGHHEIVQPTTW